MPLGSRSAVCHLLALLFLSFARMDQLRVRGLDRTGLECERAQAARHACAAHICARSA